jgi:hypothetical protein
VRSTLVNLIQKSQSITEFMFIENHHDFIFRFAERLGGQHTRVHNARSALEECCTLVKDYTNKVRLVAAFLQYWLPHSAKWDISILEAFVVRSTQRDTLIIKDIPTEVRQIVLTQLLFSFSPITKPSN